MGCWIGLSRGTGGISFLSVACMGRNWQRLRDRMNVWDAIACMLCTDDPEKHFFCVIICYKPAWQRRTLRG